MKPGQEELLREAIGEMPRVIALAQRIVTDLVTDTSEKDRMWSHAAEIKRAAKELLQIAKRAVEE